MNEAQKHTSTPWIVEDREGYGGGDWNNPQIYAQGRNKPIAVIWHEKIVSSLDPEFTNISGMERFYASDAARSVQKQKALANAEFIVRACNAHDDLLSACLGVKAMLEGMGQPIPDMLNNAIIIGQGGSVPFALEGHGLGEAA